MGGKRCRCWAQAGNLHAIMPAPSSPLALSLFLFRCHQLVRLSSVRVCLASADFMQDKMKIVLSLSLRTANKEGTGKGRPGVGQVEREKERSLQIATRCWWLMADWVALWFPLVGGRIRGRLHAQCECAQCQQIRSGLRSALAVSHAHAHAHGPLVASLGHFLLSVLPLTPSLDHFCCEHISNEGTRKCGEFSANGGRAG